MAGEGSSESAPVREGVFATTHWSVVLAAGQDGSPQAQAALEKLCGTYWYPLYAYLRRRGFGEHDAQDLTQEFFARILENNAISRADPQRGRFRTFLLTSAKNFLANEWDRNQAAKRGGGQILLSLDEQTAEDSYRLEPVDKRTPDWIFEKSWAATLLDQVLARLQSEFEAAGKGELFEQLKLFVWGEKLSGTQAELAGKMGLTEGALQVKIHRLRGRFRELLRAEIAHTVASPEEIDSELRHLSAALRA